MSLAQQSQTWFPTHVQVTVLQAKALRSKGKAGTNDAYAIIQLGKEKYSTTVAEKSQAPVWKEEASFEVPLLHKNNQERCTVHIIVMHRALVGMDKFLGQLDLNLWDLHQTKNRRKVQWYPLRSKPGKKEKERGQIEVEVEFKRNNMTASMFDLSMKEKSRSPFGKLKDKIKGKRSDGLPDTASAIVPSMNEYGDESDDEMPVGDEKKKSKLKNLFSKPGLKKNSMSQSMSVLPTLPPSPSQRTVLKPGDFSSDFTQAHGSPVSERRFPHFPNIMTHKRTASADTKQFNQVTSGNKKEGLSLFSGMRSKNDPITRSNLCINGNHVYMEETEPKSDSPKDNSLTNSPQTIRRNPMYASADNLFDRPSRETPNISRGIPDKGLTSSSSNSSLKSFELAKSESSQAEDSKSKGPSVSSDLPKESKENKKPESLKSSLLSLVTGKKETPKNSEQISDVPVKKEESKTSGTRPPADTQTKKNPFNPFEEDMEEEKKPEPFPAERNTKTSAVKPRLDVSSEAETKAKLSSSSVSDTSFLAASFYGGQGTPEVDLHNPSNLPQSTYSSHSRDKGSSSPRSPTLSEGSQDSTADSEKTSFPLFWRSGVSVTKQSESKEINVVAPFTEKNKPKKTYVKSLLDQLKGKPSQTENENVVDADLVRGILPVLSEKSSFYIEPEAVPDNNSSGLDDFGRNKDEEMTSHLNEKDITVVSTEEKSNDYVKDVPKPTPRIQSVTKKESEEEKTVPPKPAPRSAKLNKTQDPVSNTTTTQAPQPKERFSSDSVMEEASRVGASPLDGPVYSGQTFTNMKLAASTSEEYSYRLDELPVIPENPEGTSDDEQLDVKQNKIESSLHSSTKTNSDSIRLVDNGLVKKALSEESPAENNKDMADKMTSEVNSSLSEVRAEMSESAHQTSPEPLSSHHNLPSSSPSISLPSDKSSAPSVKSATTPTIDVSDKVEGSGKKKLLRAWVSPSETHPIPTVQSGGTMSSRQRTHPVKPMNTQNNISNFSQPIKSHENALNDYNSKKYDPSDPASAYAQLTHDELIQLVLKQKDIISKKDLQVRDLEDYIDSLLVRVMEATPNILRSASKKASRI